MKYIKKSVRKSHLSTIYGALFLSIHPCLVHAADAFSTDSPWMLGDWRGTRTELLQEGVDFRFNYLMETASNLAGGYNTSTTARYSDQQTFGVDFDLQKLLDWKNAEIQLTITNRDGQNLSGQVADPRTGMLSSTQEGYGRGETWRLTQFWLRKGLFGDMLDIKAGRVTVGEDFDNVDSKFQNFAFSTGAQAGHWRGNHWYNWPVSQWGGRLRINFTPEVFMQVGFYNQNQYNYNRGDGFRFEFRPTEGNLVPVELGWKPQFGADKLPGNYRLGYYYSSTNDNVYGSWRRGGFENTAHSYGGYLLAQQQLTTQGGSRNRGISLILQAVLNDHQTAKTDNYQSIVLTWRGPFDARPQDEIGLGVGRIHINSTYSRMRSNQNNLHGEIDYNSPAYIPVQDGSEYNYEVYYNLQATKWLQIRPNLQYISAPGAVRQVDDALVGGLSANISF